LCRGNHRSRYYASGGYDPVLDVFRRTRFQRFLLEYDDDRSGGFEPLRHVPEDRVVVLGLVSSKKGALESKDMLKRRIDRAALHVSLDRLALSTQCGFASTEEGNTVTAEEQAAKLRLVAETAKEIWGNRLLAAARSAQHAPGWIDNPFCTKESPVVLQDYRGLVLMRGWLTHHAIGQRRQADASRAAMPMASSRRMKGSANRQINRIVIVVSAQSLRLPFF
jgi:hypothetical protein